MRILKEIVAALVLIVVLSALALWYVVPASSSPLRTVVTVERVSDQSFYLKLAMTYASDGHGPADSTRTGWTSSGGLSGGGAHWLPGQPARDSFLINDAGAVTPIIGVATVQTYRNGLPSPQTSAAWQYVPNIPPPAPGLTTSVVPQ